MTDPSRQQQLDAAERSIALGQRHLAKQRDLVAELVRNRRDTSLAISILKVLGDSQHGDMLRIDVAEFVRIIWNDAISINFTYGEIVASVIRDEREENDVMLEHVPD